VRDLGTALADVRQTVEFISEFAEEADLLARKATEELIPADGEKKGIFLDMVHEIRMRAKEAARGTREVNALIAAGPGARPRGRVLGRRGLPPGG
jgi:hypothetical protein